ncbi:MAG: polysaccharide biosynthesis C-terminal domain-containing protein [Bacteroidota bacterium]
MPDSLSRWTDWLGRWINTVNAFQFFQLFRSGTAILISIVLAKSSLAVGDIAVYEWLLYMGAFVSFFWVNALLQALLPMYPQLEKTLRKPFLSNVYGLFCLLSLLLVSMLYIAPSFWTTLLTGQEELPYFHWYLLLLLVNLPTSLVEYLYLLEERSPQIVGYGAVSFGSYFVAVVTAVWLGWGLEGAIQGMVIVGLLRFLWLSHLTAPWKHWSWQGPSMKAYLVLGAPLVLYSFLAGFAQMFDQWLVGWYFEEREPFAIFRYGARELPLATALAGGLSAALIPEVSKNLRGSLDMVRAKSLRIYHWLFPFSIVLMLTSPYLYPWVYSPEFAPSARIFNLYLLLVASRVLMPYSLLMGLKQTKVILSISILELSINIALSLWWIDSYGLEGIALATVVAFLFEKLVMILYLYFRHGIRPGQYIPLLWYGGYVVLLLLAYVISI